MLNFWMVVRDLAHTRSSCLNKNQSISVLMESRVLNAAGTKYYSYTTISLRAPRSLCQVLRLVLAQSLPCPLPKTYECIYTNPCLIVAITIRQ